MDDLHPAVVLVILLACFLLVGFIETL